MSCDSVISVQGISKCYQVYESPSDRLKQFVVPKLPGLSDKCYFKNFWALNDISFSVNKGETVALVGRNGSGKSTLLQIICGTLNATSGTSSVNGRVAALLELGSGFNPEFTGVENVYMNATILGLTKKEVDERLNDIVSFADIGEFIDRPVKTYSSGMMLRLAFAVIAHVDADVLIVDEALAVGDAVFTQKCMSFLRSFMKTGTVLFVSHDISSVKSLCNRAIWLNQGQVIQDGDPKSVCESYLEACYAEKQVNAVQVSNKKKEANNNANSVLDKENRVDDELYDQRRELILGSTLRNDIEVFKFNQDASSFGTGKARIVDVSLKNIEGRKLNWCVGGEKVLLSISTEVYDLLDSPIVGFFVNDRLGQTLFGDNTFISHNNFEKDFVSGDKIEAEFLFNMPILPPGDYSINVAIANGTQVEHEQLHWIHTAVSFKSTSSSSSTGLVGIPMLDINLKRIN